MREKRKYTIAIIFEGLTFHATFGTLSGVSLTREAITLKCGWIVLPLFFFYRMKTFRFSCWLNTSELKTFS